MPYQSDDARIGFLPIRALNNNIASFFEGFCSTTVQDSKDLMKEGRLRPEIDFDIDRGKARTPHVNGERRMIYLHEPFLASQWTTAYFLITMHDTMVWTQLEGKSLEIAYAEIPRLRHVERLVMWGRSLYSEWSPWPEGLPNPEVCELAEVEYCNKISGIYLSAVSCCMLHELGHVESRHHENYADLLGKSPTSRTVKDIDDLRIMENEADVYVLDRIVFDLNALPKGQLLIRYIGLISSYVNVLLSKNSIESLRGSRQYHPELHSRIQNAIDHATQYLSASDVECLRVMSIIGFMYFFRFTDQEFNCGEGCAPKKVLGAIFAYIEERLEAQEACKNPD